MLETKPTLEKNFAELINKNTKLQYQVNYLRQHINASSLPPAKGQLRELQLKSINFAKEVLDILKTYDLNPFMLCGALVGYMRHNKSFVPWEDNLDFGLMQKDFWRLIEILREDFIFLEALEPSDSHILSSLDDALHAYPHKIIGFQTPHALHICQGTSLENHTNIEFLPFYYWNENSTTRDFLQYAKKVHSKISQSTSWNEIFSFYKQELANSLYCEHSNKIAPGVGNGTLITKKFSGFHTNEHFFPLQSIVFENIEFPTISDMEYYLKYTYGDYTQIPNDVGITVTSSVIHAYLQTKGRGINMPEASVTCKHNG